MAERVGNYWFMLPEAAQARKAIWEGKTESTRGLTRVDYAFPAGAVRRKRDQDMYLELVNGSTFQVVGADNFNSLVGSPPVGVVFSEYALTDPHAWAYLRPILLENGGRVSFNSTVRGRNHFKSLMDTVQADPASFAQTLPATKTNVFTPEQLDQERAEYVAEYGPHIGNALFEQEYLCNWDSPVLGAYYADLIRQAEDDGRITSLPVDPRYPVETWWDLGRSDQTAVWFVQHVGGAVHVVDFMVSSGVGIDWYAEQIQARGYPNCRTAVLPHDGDNETINSKFTVQAALRRFGFDCDIVEPPKTKPVGIAAVRALIPRCLFDAEKCKHGIDGLRSYHAKWDDKRKALMQHPEHDWASDIADAFQTGALRDKRALPMTAAKRIRYRPLSSVA